MNVQESLRSDCCASGSMGALASELMLVGTVIFLGYRQLLSASSFGSACCEPCVRMLSHQQRFYSYLLGIVCQHARSTRGSFVTTSCYAVGSAGCGISELEPSAFEVARYMSYIRMRQRPTLETHLASRRFS
eukprot:6329962-Amphidinium_carterae.1